MLSPLKTLCVLCALLLLASCGGGDAPATETNTNADATETVAVSEEGTPQAIILVTRQASEEETPDILENFGAEDMIASATEDPDRDLVFDRLQFARYGGRFPDRIDITLNQDGTLTRNDVSGSVSPDIVLQVDTLLDEINFFGIQNIMVALAAETSNTRYNLRVVRGGNDRTITSEDGYMPPEYMALIGALLTLGQ